MPCMETFKAFLKSIEQKSMEDLKAQNKMKAGETDKVDF